MSDVVGAAAAVRCLLGSVWRAAKRSWGARLLGSSDTALVVEKVLESVGMARHCELVLCQSREGAVRDATWRARRSSMWTAG